jgi:hypothetical protein
MSRIKDEIPSVRVRLDGQLKPGQDDDILDWLKSLPKKTKFPSVIKRLRMGSALSSVTAETTDEEVLRLVREAEQAADAFFDKYNDDE